MPIITPTESMPDKDAFIFDLDGTLAESKAPLTDMMASTLGKFLAIKKVSIISGGNFKQFETQVVDRIKEVVEHAIIHKEHVIATPRFENLYLQPTTGARMYSYMRGEWKEVYAEYLTEDEKIAIRKAFDEVLPKYPFARPERLYGEQLEDRGSQITYSALGQGAPVEEKKAWDPDLSKHKILIEELQKILPSTIEVRGGGLTSLDVLRKGIDKSYGIRKFGEYVGLDTSRMCFIGDAIYEGGNDYPAMTAGVDCIKVPNPDFTNKMLQQWMDR